MLWWRACTAFPFPLPLCSRQLCKPELDGKGLNRNCSWLLKRSVYFRNTLSSKNQWQLDKKKKKRKYLIERSMASLDQRSSQLRLDVADHLKRKSQVEKTSKVKPTMQSPVWLAKTLESPLLRTSLTPAPSSHSLGPHGRP